jgi:transcriptional regulator with XRE-family HTH domain
LGKKIYTFGNILKEFRVGHGLTQRVIAEKLDTTQEMISYYERGIHLPELDKLPMFAAKLKVIFEITEHGFFIKGKLPINTNASVVSLREDLIQLIEKHKNDPTP